MKSDHTPTSKASENGTSTSNASGTASIDGQSHDEIREHLHRQMLSAVSHDLKTPLSTVIGSLEVINLMGARLSEDKRKTLIGSALTEAYRLDNFITNILDMAKFEAEAVRPRPQPVGLHQLIQDALTRLGPLKARGRIEVIRGVGDDGLTTDPMLSARAIGLVIENALKHGGSRGPDGAEAPVIEISLGFEEGHPCVRIRDHGAGIPADKQTMIFDKYTRLSKADQQNAGTGLGLTLCRHIMTLLGGQVTVTNHEDGGAVFKLCWPK
ncbi:sensor histidine kinase [Asticcacaulis machinosus]|uniref:histidine kinase n=1 Tax=Asticcacaulis machinosus TaxID=2984211 RepID=A0ABT5HKG0_9CAUL|nr:ATP-binding protein [Asticcacaulis machinosus]MDC7676732.1 ATP-binding protein [Asticcacaulis machinosus]